MPSASTSYSLLYRNLEEAVDSLLHAIVSVLGSNNIDVRTVGDEGRGYHQSDALSTRFQSEEDA